MFRQRKAAPGIGLDIGTTQAALTRVKHRRGKLQVVNYGSIPIPSGTADAGLVNDPVRLGQALAQLVERLNLKGKRVVSSVSGPQVYIRNIVLPKMKISELKEAALFEATTFLPIPVEEAVIDIFPIRHFDDSEGKKTELFFVAVRRQQVDNLRITCEVAGLNLVAVELDPIALHRIAGSIGSDIQPFLYVGTTRSYFCVVKNGALIFQRYFSSGTAAISSAVNPQEEPGLVLQCIDLTGDEEKQYLVRDIISESSRSLEYFRMQFREEEIKLPVVLCGSGARINGLERVLGDAMDHQVLKADTASRLLMPKNTSVNERQELAFDYLISLGLAAREVI